MTDKNNIVPGIVYVDGRDKTPNEKLYLVLLKGENKNDDRLDFKDFQWIVGRQKVYEYLRDLIRYEEDALIDIHASSIISETVTINDYISVYEFMKTFKDIVIDDTGFDIEEYNIEGDIGFESEE